MPNETGRARGHQAMAEDPIVPDHIQAVQPAGLGGLRPGSGVLPMLRVAPSPAPRDKLKAGAAGPIHWSSFWEDFTRDGALHERCHVPGDGRAAVDRHWAQIAERLPHGADVIDLGCGAGVLGHMLLDHRSDLQVTGVDFAKVPTAAPANLTIHPWVSMEDLPFDDGSFDAAISLFGIEYGNIELTARELARVLRPGAGFSFLVHHAESEILREGGVRRRALREMLSGPMKAAFLTGSVDGINRACLRLRAQFGDEPSVRLFSDHLRRQATRTRAERLAMWQKLADDLEPELALLGHLERSAKSAAAMGAWLAPLLSIMVSVRVAVLRTGSRQPIAWEVSGTR